MAYGQTPVAKGAIYRISNGSVVDRFNFQYNPTEYQENMGVEWVFSQAPGQYLPVAVFGKFAKTTIPFELFLYGRERGVTLSTGTANVPKEVARLKLFFSPGPEFSAENPQFVSPGRTKLIMGSRVWNGVLNTGKISYQMFDRDMNPVMARAALSFTVTSGGFDEELAHIEAIRARAELDG